MAARRPAAPTQRGICLLGVLFPCLPGLFVRLSEVFLRFKREAKRGGKRFRQQLLSEGIDKKTAEELTQVYLESSSLHAYVDVIR
jgi:hypothetical protein